MHIQSVWHIWHPVFLCWKPKHFYNAFSYCVTLRLQKIEVFGFYFFVHNIAC